MNYLAFRLTKYWTFSYDICFFLSVLTKLLPPPKKKPRWLYAGLSCTIYQCWRLE